MNSVFRMFSYLLSLLSLVPSWHKGLTSARFFQAMECLAYHGINGPSYIGKNGINGYNEFVT